MESLKFYMWVINEKHHSSLDFLLFSFLSLDFFDPSFSSDTLFLLYSDYSVDFDSSFFTDSLLLSDFFVPFSVYFFSFFFEAQQPTINKW